jgi:hypothetical protein
MLQIINSNNLPVPKFQSRHQTIFWGEKFLGMDDFSGKYLQFPIPTQVNISTFQQTALDCYEFTILPNL